jgi:hypothetical protein
MFGTYQTKLIDIFCVDWTFYVRFWLGLWEFCAFEVYLGLSPSLIQSCRAL